MGRFKRIVALLMVLAVLPFGSFKSVVGAEHSGGGKEFDVSNAEKKEFRGYGRDFFSGVLLTFMKQVHTFINGDVEGLLLNHDAFEDWKYQKGIFEESYVYENDKGEVYIPNELTNLLHQYFKEMLNAINGYTIYEGKGTGLPPLSMYENVDVWMSYTSLVQNSTMNPHWFVRYDGNNGHIGYLRYMVKSSVAEAVEEAYYYLSSDRKTMYQKVADGSTNKMMFKGVVVYNNKTSTGSVDSNSITVMKDEDVGKVVGGINFADFEKNGKGTLIVWNDVVKLNQYLSDCALNAYMGDKFYKYNEEDDNSVVVNVDMDVEEIKKKMDEAYKLTKEELKELKDINGKIPSTDKIREIVEKNVEKLIEEMEEVNENLDDLEEGMKGMTKVLKEIRDEVKSFFSDAREMWKLHFDDSLAMQYGGLYGILGEVRNSIRDINDPVVSEIIAAIYAIEHEINIDNENGGDVTVTIDVKRMEFLLEWIMGAMWEKDVDGTIGDKYDNTNMGYLEIICKEIISQGNGIEETKESLNELMGKITGILEDVAAIRSDSMDSEDHLLKIKEQLIEVLGKIEETSEKEVNAINKLVNEVNKIDLWDIETLLRNMEGYIYSVYNTLIDVEQNGDYVLSAVRDILRQVEEGDSDIIRELKSIKELEQRQENLLQDIYEKMKEIDDDGFMKKFKDLGEKAKGKFPLSIPWDTVAIVALFASKPEVPKFEVEFPLPMVKNQKFTIDLTRYEALSVVSRSILSVLFLMYLLNLTRKLTGGGWGSA